MRTPKINAIIKCFKSGNGQNVTMNGTKQVGSATQRGKIKRWGRLTWKNFGEAFEPLDFMAGFILFEAEALLYEATECFDAGAYTATVLVCRAALESAFYGYTTRTYSDLGGLSYNGPLTLDGKERQVEYDELSRAVKTKVRFGRKQSIAIRRIQEDGNFAAHLGYRRTKELKRSGDEMKKLYEAFKGQNVSDRIRHRAYRKVEKETRSWITIREALRNLRDTSSILLVIARTIRTDYYRVVPWARTLRKG
jgi:hypothetical protein